MKTKADKLAALRDAISAIEHAPEASLFDGEQEAEEESAFSRIVRLSSFRDRTTSEVRRRLIDEGFESSEIEDAIERAHRCGLVDDCRYADSRIRSLVRKGKGARYVASDLQERGIDVADVPGWPCAYYEQDGKGELDRALDVLRRKPSRSKDPFRGAYQKLIRYGYSSDVSFRAAKRWASELKD